MSNFQVITIKTEPKSYDTEVQENIHEDEPGSRCGEIYVGNNAKKWTFICTLCDKSVCEIDEFISHIKTSHVNIPPPPPVEPCESSHVSLLQNSVKHEVPLFNSLEKTLSEFVDYNDFLDVNVQTVPDVILSETNRQIEVPVNPVKIATSESRVKCVREPKKDVKAPKTSRSSNCLPAEFCLPFPSVKTTQQVETPSTEILRIKKKKWSRQKQIKGPAFCQICKRSFQYHSLYRNHMVKHTSETPFQCTICKKGFKSKQAIRYHMTTHQREKPFKCELCSSGFFHEWQFVSHMETHKSENTHPCEVCGKLNRSKNDKMVHMRTHTGDRPFACEFCSKRFRLRHHLSNHLKLHLTYRCDYCRKQFSNGVPMKKPYACPECYVNSHNQTDIKVGHLLFDDDEDSEDSDDEAKDVTFHPVKSPKYPKNTKPYTCKLCNKTYANKRGLSVHISTKH